MHQRSGVFESLFWDAFCRIFCHCPPRFKPQVTVKGISRTRDRSSFTFIGDRFMGTVSVDGGPVIELNVDKFVDDKGNTTTDNDTPVWSIQGNDANGNPLADLVAPSPNGGPQSAQITIKGTVGALQVNAAFGDQSKLGTPGNYLLTGTLNVVPGLAVSGQIEMSGSGVTNP